MLAAVFVSLCLHSLVNVDSCGGFWGVGSFTLAAVSLVLAVRLSDKVHAKRLFDCGSLMVLFETHHELPSL